MSILRYTASIDTTITNAFQENLSTRGTGSNMGASDILETFSIYQQASTSSVELSRVLIQFPMTQITTDRDTTKILPAAGSVTWKLKLYNAVHSETVPRSYDFKVSAVSASWQEGTGLDMEAYSDLTNDGEGSNWIARSGTDIAATATVTWVSGDRPEAGDTIKIIDAAGVSKTYIAAAAQDLTTDPPKWYASNTTTTQVDSLHACIESEKGHNGSITVSQDGTGLIMTLTQVTKGPDGNTTITVAGATSGQLSSTNFIDGSNYTPWSSIGGDYHATPTATQNLDTGLEDLEIDVTTIVEQWLDDTKTNYGFGIRLTDAYEGYFSSSTGANNATEIHNTSGAKKSYYTKKFFGRGTEFFFKRPVLEAQFDNTKKDNRGNFVISSSAQPAADNLNKLYLYNYIRGRLVDLVGAPTLKLYYSSGSVPEGTARGFRKSNNAAVTSLVSIKESTGVYYVQVAVTGGIVNSTYPYLVDVWEYSSTEFFTGSAFTPLRNDPRDYKSNKSYVMSMPNLLEEYRSNQTARLRLYAREKNWSPNIYTTAKNKPENLTIESGSYRLLRVVDDLEVISYGTGSVKYSELSYDVSGNYFDFDMKLLESGYQYGFKFSIYDDFTQTYMEQPYLFKFRVVK